MSTISRRSFLKLAGVTAVATAGASMLTGCSWFDNIELVIMGSVDDGETYKEVLRKTLPRIAVNFVKGNINLALDLVKKHGPEEYRGADVTVDSSYPNSLTFIKDEKTGKESLIIAVKLAMVEVEYEVLVNGKSVSSGKQAVPKGLKVIPADKALELAKGKLNYPPYNTATLEIDKDYPNNLTVVDGKVTIALLGYKG